MWPYTFTQRTKNFTLATSDSFYLIPLHKYFDPLNPIFNENSLIKTVTNEGLDWSSTHEVSVKYSEEI